MHKVINNLEDFISLSKEKSLNDLVIKNIEISNWVPERRQIIDTNFQNCKFIGGENTFLQTIFKNVSFLNCELDGVLFNSSSLTKSRFTNTNLNKCKFERNMWNDVLFYHCVVLGCDLSNELLIGCKFEYGEFKGNNVEGLKHRESGQLFDNALYSDNYGTMKNI